MRWPRWCSRSIRCLGRQRRLRRLGRLRWCFWWVCHLTSTSPLVFWSAGGPSFRAQVSPPGLTSAQGLT
ncbi:hypothetical protein STRAU_5037 [Streptomyces aurantiacus JA 4570]|uniref:Uncharacterized protein n=1 Tax=Streptomyces aurantiacus JA 4570 TaxID=1286094 RepID=S3ZTW1_9ACTN|nr:hypothetical protein STRAU_5037 [Streptomyces aurantiacus JA 4570]